MSAATPARWSMSTHDTSARVGWRPTSTAGSDPSSSSSTQESFCANEEMTRPSTIPLRRISSTAPFGAARVSHTITPMPCSAAAPHTSCTTWAP
jgi:hypothetical protein